MNGCDGISSAAMDDVISSHRVSPFRFSIDISLIENSDLVGEIETALTIESAEMVLLTLRRVDEVILVAPHMVPAWKKLLDRLVRLEPKSALKYVTEMSLHWNPLYAETMIGKAQEKIYGESLQEFIIFFRGTQAIGNELDIYGMNIWGELTMERLSREGLPDIISSLLDTVPTSFFSKGYSRTPYGVDYTIFQSYVNPDFCKKIAETLLLLIGEYMKKFPWMAATYSIPCAIRILGRGIDQGMLQRFFSSWKEGVRIIAEEDVDWAMRILEDGEDNPFLKTHGAELESLKQDLSTRSGSLAINQVSTLGQGCGGPSSAVLDWKMAKDDICRSQAINRWKKNIAYIAKTNPESAIDAIYDFIESYCIDITEDEGFIQTVQETFGGVMDMIFAHNPHRGLLLLREQSLLVTSFSKSYFLKKILEHIHCVEVSHPDLVLSLYWHMDYALSRGSFEVDYSEGRIERYRKILESIIRAAKINLLEAIRGCEHIMTFSGKDSEIYDTAVSFWREYMKQLENRHAKTAGDMYSNFHATMRHISGYEDIASESNAGYERCLKKREFQACTSSPFTGTSTISGNLGS